MDNARRTTSQTHHQTLGTSQPSTSRSAARASPYFGARAATGRGSAHTNQARGGPPARPQPCRGSRSRQRHRQTQELRCPPGAHRPKSVSRAQARGTRLRWLPAPPTCEETFACPTGRRTSAHRTRAGQTHPKATGRQVPGFSPSQPTTPEPRAPPEPAGANPAPPARRPAPPALKTPPQHRPATRPASQSGPSRNAARPHPRRRP
jgi:hypothetical protein